MGEATDEEAPRDAWPGRGGQIRRGADEQWVRECRLAVERAEQRVRSWRPASPRPAASSPTRPSTAPSPSGPPRPGGAIEQARTANGQAELDLMHATELAKVALDGLMAARAGADWRALDHARQARADAAAAGRPAWEALRCAGLRIARADYELDRLIEEWLSNRP